MKDPGQVLKRLRTEHGVTQRQLAAALSVDPTTISQYENGKRNIPTNLVEPLCAYFDIPVLDLMKEIFPEEHQG